mmetsp:Transcript_19981/g.47220  ORF Transcript_19981/g.47220 Transcript_19981/m.47220 type:complete len:207 (-) Transcript_19981:834-1454(-)
MCAASGFNRQTIASLAPKRGERLSPRTSILFKLNGALFRLHVDAEASVQLADLHVHLAELALHKCLKPSLGLDEPILVKDELGNVHRASLTTQAQAPHEELLDFHRAASIHVQKLEEAPSVGDVQAQTFEILTHRRGIELRLEHVESDEPSVIRPKLAEERFHLVHMLCFVFQDRLHHGGMVFLGVLNGGLAEHTCDNVEDREIRK